MKIPKNLTSKKISTSPLGANNLDKSKKEKSTKVMSTADKVKIAFIAVIGTAAVLQFAGVPTFSTVKGVFAGETTELSADDAYAGLESTFSDTKPSASSLPAINAIDSSGSLPSAQSMPVANTQPSKQIVSSKATTPQTTKSVVPSQPKRKEVPNFVVADDYRTVIAAAQIYKNAINPEVEKEWVNVRLQVNAEREKNRLAQVRLQRVKAEADTARYQKETSDLMEAIQSSQQNASEVASGNFTGTDIELMSIGKNTVDVLIGNKAYYSRSTNSQVSDMQIVLIDADKGCATFEMPSNKLRSVCI